MLKQLEQTLRQNQQVKYAESNNSIEVISKEKKTIERNYEQKCQ